MKVNQLWIKGKPQEKVTCAWLRLECLDGECENSKQFIIVLAVRNDDGCWYEAVDYLCEFQGDDLVSEKYNNYKITYWQSPFIPEVYDEVIVAEM